MIAAEPSTQKFIEIANMTAKSINAFSKISGLSMLRFLVCNLIFIVGLVASFSAQAEQGQDHPLVPRLPGYKIVSYAQNDFDAYDKELCRDGKPSLKFHAEGKLTRIEYVNLTNPASDLAVLRNYQNALKKIGATEINICSKVREPHVMKLVRDNRELYAVIWPTGGSYILTIIESQPMQQLISANDMHNALAKDGFIALYINFDTNKSDVKPEAEATVKEIVKLMKADPGLKLSVEGHTDNVGNAASNKTLSMNRAKSVMNAVIKQGIAATRLSAQGFGQEQPIADNRIEEGRAKNRRVELVKAKN